MLILVFFLFQTSVKSKSRRNVIQTLNVDDDCIEGVSEICPKVVNYFLNHFKKSLIDRPHLDKVVFHSFQDKDNNIFFALFFLPELGWAVTQCDDNNSPDLDGFNSSFLKRFCNLLREDQGSIFDNFIVLPFFLVFFYDLDP